MKTLTRASIAAGTLLSAASPVFAQKKGGINVNPSSDYFQIDNIGTLISGIVSFAMIIAALLVFLYLVWGGIAYITSGGDKGKTEEARNRISAALIGLAIVAASWAVVLLIQTFFGFSVFSTEVVIPTAYQ